MLKNLAKFAFRCLYFDSVWFWYMIGICAIHSKIVEKFKRPGKDKLLMSAMLLLKCRAMLHCFCSSSSLCMYTLVGALGLKRWIKCLSIYLSTSHKEGIIYWVVTLQWCHNEHDGVSNYRRRDCSPNRLFGNIKTPCHWLLWGKLNSPVSGGFSAQRASNAEHVSIWWHHRDLPQVWDNHATFSCTDFPNSS